MFFIFVVRTLGFASQTGLMLEYLKVVLGKSSLLGNKVILVLSNIAKSP